MHYVYHDTPIGPLLLAGREPVLQLLSFPGGDRVRRPEAGWQLAPDAFAEVRRQLDAYFDGHLRTFDVPLDPQVTPFRRRVLDALRTIPYGQTRSYGDIARQIGQPSASRAVGAANGANPIPVIIPCHRVIGSTGKLTGFGGGLPTKRFLLALEQDADGLFGTAPG